MFVLGWCYASKPPSTVQRTVKARLGGAIIKEVEDTSNFRFLMDADSWRIIAETESLKLAAQLGGFMIFGNRCLNVAFKSRQSKFSGIGTFIRRWISNSAGDEYHNYFDKFITEVTKNSGTYRIL